MKTVEKVQQVGAMVVAATFLGGNIVLSKVAANDGMPVSIMVAYRWIFATAFLSPIAIVVEWYLIQLILEFMIYFKLQNYKFCLIKLKELQIIPYFETISLCSS